MSTSYTALRDLICTDGDGEGDSADEGSDVETQDDNETN